MLTLRYGFSTWQDSCDPQPYSSGIGALGFSQNYVSQVSEQNVFPRSNFDQVADVGGWGGARYGGTARTRQRNAVEALGSHSIKVGGDLRRLSVELATETEMTGTFDFNSLFTSNNGVGGHELASLLLGLPATGRVPYNRGAGDWFTKYYGAYIQDDWRVNSKLSVNYGVRFEHEDGLQEVENRQSVGFDRDAISPLNSQVPKTGLLTGRTITGGLIFAGVDGAPTHQGDPAAIKIAPRGGFSYAINRMTVFRGGYGLSMHPGTTARRNTARSGSASGPR